MKLKSIFGLLLFLLMYQTGHAQENTGYTTGLSSLLAWISSFDDLLSGIENKENLKKISRKLGYISLDVDNIKNEKLFLAKDLSTYQEDQNENHIPELNDQITQIEGDINSLLSHLQELKSLLSQSNQQEVGDIMAAIEYGFRSRKLYLLKDIKEYLFEGNIPNEKIIEEAMESKEIAEEALIKIREAQSKIVSVI